MSKAKEILKKNTMLIALVIVTLFFYFMTNGTLLAPQNVSNLIAQNGYVVILAVGMLMCILTGGNIDLSTGSVVALVGAVAGTLIINMKMNIYLSMVICLIIGVLIGAWQGFWIAYVRIPAFIVTLSGMLTWRGAALIVLNGMTLSPYPDHYLRLFNSFVPDFLGGGKFNLTALVVGIIISVAYVAVQILDRAKKSKKGYEVESIGMMVGKIVVICAAVLALSYAMASYKGIPTILIILAVIVLAYAYYTSRTVPGRHLYAMGGNEKAAKLSGINTNKVLFLAYVNMSFLSALAALVCVARFNSSAPTAGTNFEMDAIGACYIGGASAYGGVGTVVGAVIGAIFMGVLNNGMSITGIDSNWQKVVKGLVLLAAVAFDVISKKRSKAS